VERSPAAWEAAEDDLRDSMKIFSGNIDIIIDLICYLATRTGIGRYRKFEYTGIGIVHLVAL